MLRHQVIDVKVFDVNHKLIGDWGFYDNVPMEFGSREVGCWGVEWSIKFNFVSSHRELHYVHIFLLGADVADNTAKWDLGALRNFVPVDEKQVLVSCIYPSPWKRLPISLDMPLLRFSFPGPFISCRYSWAFPVSGQMTVFSLPGSNVSLPVSWSITNQYSPAGCTRGAGFLGK